MFRGILLLLVIMLMGAASVFANQAAQGPMTNKDVIAMVKNALPENVIIGAIRANAADFDVSANALIALKKAGVSPRILQAMISAAGGNGAGSKQSAVPAPPATSKSASGGDETNVAASPASQPILAYVAAKRKVTLTAEPTQIASTKAKPTTLAAMAKDAVVEQALQVGTQVAQNALIRTGSAAGATAFGSGTNVVTGIFARRRQQAQQQQKTTYVWALNGGSSDNAVAGNAPVFEITYSGLPGVNADRFEPVIVKLAVTPQANFRLVGATEGTVSAGHDPQHDWPIYSSFVEERVASKLEKLSSGRSRIRPAAALPSGQYGVALRPIDKGHKFSGEEVANNQGEGLLFNYVWPFSVN